MRAKPDLVRVVRSVEGYGIDPSGKRPGRGAYVCAQPACVARAGKHKGFERSYKSGFPKELYAEILETVSKGVSPDDA